MLLLTDGKEEDLESNLNAQKVVVGQRFPNFRTVGSFLWSIRHKEDDPNGKRVVTLGRRPLPAIGESDVE